MLLAIDTSTQQIGLSLYDGSSIIAEELWITQNHHTVELSPSLEHLFNKCGVNAASLSVLAVALGPGSFTGLRIGLSVVKGLALALNIPVTGIPTMDILAAAQPLNEIPLATIIQAGRGRLAICWYEPDQENNLWKSQGDISVVTIEELSRLIKSPTIICGELHAHERQILERKRKNVLLVSPAQSARRPSYLAEMGWRKYKREEWDDVNTLSPIYLHQVEVKK